MCEESENKIAADGSKLALVVKAGLVEYSSLREESISTITNRIRIITLGFIASSIIISGVFVAKKVPDLLKILFLFAILPQLSKASLLMWFGEYKRMIRAADRMIEIEQKVNKTLDETVMKWESGLPSQAPVSIPYYAAILLVSIPSLIAYVLAAHLLFSVMGFSSSSVGIVLFGLILLLAVIWEIVFYSYFISEWWKIRKNRRERSKSSC